MTEQKRSDLEHQLVAAGYDGLFLYGERSRADALWARGGNQPALEGIIADATTSLQTKFLAAELLRAKGVRLSSAAAPVCAEAYAAALASTSETSGNPWRLNGNVWGFVQHADDPGVLGRVLIGLGRVAVPHLVKLLSDDGAIIFEGSREATTGNKLQLRVKDFAAYYLSQIEGIAVPLREAHAERDAEIEKLKQAVARRP